MILGISGVTFYGKRLVSDIRILSGSKLDNDYVLGIGISVGTLYGKRPGGYLVNGLSQR